MSATRFETGNSSSKLRPFRRLGRLLIGTRGRNINEYPSLDFPEWPGEEASPEQQARIEAAKEQILAFNEAWMSRLKDYSKNGYSGGPELRIAKKGQCYSDPDEAKIAGHYNVGRGSVWEILIREQDGTRTEYNIYAYANEDNPEGPVSVSMRGPSEVRPRASDPEHTMSAELRTNSYERVAAVMSGIRMPDLCVKEDLYTSYPEDLSGYGQ